MTHPHPASDVAGSPSTHDSDLPTPASAQAEPPLLGEAERHHLLEEWSHGGGSYPSDPTLHALFAAQVRTTPTHPACHHGEATLTYQQLDEQITRLAAHLHTLLAPDQP